MKQPVSPASTARPYIGGQALLEGVMMRSPKSFSVVCRRRDGSLTVRERPIHDERTGVRSLPFVRGVMALVESLKLGSEAMKFAAAQFEADLDVDEKSSASPPSKKKAPGALAALSLPIVSLATMAPDEPTPAAEKKGINGGTVVMALFAIGLFVAAPQVAANGVNKLLHLGLDIRSPAFQAITGVAKLAIVIGYLALIRRVPDIYRVFQYHGAEHKTISTYEAQEDLVVANARAKTTLHPRCGTTFLVMVAMVSVVVFSAIGVFLPHVGKEGGIVENLALFAMKLPFIPLLTAVTFELQRLTARYCTTGPLRALLWPGFLVQKITTIEPDDPQLEVALASMRAALWRESHGETAPEQTTERAFPSYAELAADRGYEALAAE